ncbi:PREDICTED: uncharacterized protein LOC109150405 [Ipomoea nil]|uniref:uncharacterized protein LOC109150405 n=1 Tax=Ipomoea nil TaxID=35883 RepID=UPI0009010F3A|nr:PREDICTED: uncharacterized protein LOC109150405 [Ipomoea nil]
MVAQTQGRRKLLSWKGMAVSLNYEMLESRCISSPASSSQGRRSPLHRKVLPRRRCYRSTSPRRCYYCSTSLRGRRPVAAVSPLPLKTEANENWNWTSGYIGKSSTLQVRKRKRKKALIMAVDAFCKLVKKQADVAQLITK